MKNILIFSNPFGYGPAGKAISVARRLKSRARDCKVYICGGESLRLLAGGEFDFLECDERSEEGIGRIFDTVEGENLVFSSQNRFAIKAAVARGIPCAFLDGLAWFWNSIPEEHYLADIIFWLDYPGMASSVPPVHQDKVFMVGGITDIAEAEGGFINRSGILIYIGGCANPLTGTPNNYLRLVGRLIENLPKEYLSRISLACDLNSGAYLKERCESIAGLIKTYPHAEFIKLLKSSSGLIANGGQTASLEAVSASTPLNFFLPINLSQLALIDRLANFNKMNWRDYINLPANFCDYSEKDAIIYLDAASAKILDNGELFLKVSHDFNDLASRSESMGDNSFLSKVGSNGAEEIYNILSKKWDI